MADLHCLLVLACLAIYHALPTRSSSSPVSTTRNSVSYARMLGPGESRRGTHGGLGGVGARGSCARASPSRLIRQVQCPLGMSSHHAPIETRSSCRFKLSRGVSRDDADVRGEGCFFPCAVLGRWDSEWGRRCSAFTLWAGTGTGEADRSYCALVLVPGRGREGWGLGVEDMAVGEGWVAKWTEK